MKKKILCVKNKQSGLVFILVSMVIILLVGIIVWYNAPIKLMDLDHNEIMEIVVFNGNSGNTTHIKDDEQIQDIKVKRSKLSAGYSGYSFKVTIYLADGSEAGDWNNFIINSDYSISKDPFFYSVIKGKIDYNYIKNIVE